MSLEKLKSAYANIELPKPIAKKVGKDSVSPNLTPEKSIKEVNTPLPTPEKQGKLVNKPLKTIEKLGKDVNSNIQSNLTDKFSQFGLQIEKQENDFIGNKFDGILFKGQKGIMGKHPNVSLMKGSREYEWPGAGNWIIDQKAGGFKLDSTHKASTLFEGALHDNTPNAKWLNNINFGGSFLAISKEKQKNNFIWDDGKKIDYTQNNVTHPGPVDFQGITSMWTTQLTGLDFPEGFTINMKDSELVKGYRTLSKDGSEFRNTNQYSIGNYSFTDTIGETGVEGFKVKKDSFVPSGYDGIPNTLDGTWTPSTTYSDSIHTQNSIVGSFGDPVDFMSGMSLHEASLAHSGSITGFTNNYNPGMLGGWSSDNPKGDSKILGLWNTEYRPNELLTSLWTGYTGNANEPTIEFSNQLDFVNGADVLVNSILPEIGNVDFMSGMSLHEASLANSGSISGFDINYNPGSFGGWTASNTEGDSKILGLWNTDFSPNEVLTSLTTGYIDKDNNTIDFPGNTYDVPNFPGGFSSNNPIGDTSYLDNQGTLLTDMYSAAINSTETLNFNEENLFNNQTLVLRSGVESDIFKGSNTGGELSPQFDKLYNTIEWDQSAKEAKYAGPVQDGSNINNLDRFNLKADIWNSGDRIARIENGRAGSFSNFSVAQLATFSQDPITKNFGLDTEPYIVDHIGNIDDGDWYTPYTALKKDTIRISKFLSSQAGERFITRQKLLGTYQQYKTIYEPGATLLNVSTPTEGFALPMVNYGRDETAFGSFGMEPQPTTYSEYIEARSTGTTGVWSITQGGNQFEDDSSAFWGGPANVSPPMAPPDPIAKPYGIREVQRKPSAYKAVDKIGGVMGNFAAAMGVIFPKQADFGGLKDKTGLDHTSGVGSTKNMNVNMDSRTAPLGNLGKGDPMTLFPVQALTNTVGNKTVNLDFNRTDNSDAALARLNSSQNGMPFYFRDLRDNNLLFFRAYIESLNETLSPNWNSEEYIGRSEPVYTYKNAEREISFTLKLFAQTKDELNMIYKKMDRLTSMVYPEYKNKSQLSYSTVDEAGTVTTSTKEFGAIGSKDRMKPPLLKFRLGELFGSPGHTTVTGVQSFDSSTGGSPTPSSGEMTGFLKTLAYTYPDESPWEIQEGYRVPKYVQVEIGFQVIHAEVPSLDFALEDPDTGVRRSFYGITRAKETSNYGGGPQVGQLSPTIP